MHSTVRHRGKIKIIYVNNVFNTIPVSLTCFQYLTIFLDVGGTCILQSWWNFAICHQEFDRCQAINVVNELNNPLSSEICRVDVV